MRLLLITRDTQSAYFLFEGNVWKCSIKLEAVDAVLCSSRFDKMVGSVSLSCSADTLLELMEVYCFSHAFSSFRSNVFSYVRTLTLVHQERLWRLQGRF